MEQQDQDNNNGDKRPPENQLPQAPAAKRIKKTRRGPAQLSTLSSESDAEIAHLQDIDMTDRVSEANFRLQPPNYDSDSNGSSYQSTDEPQPTIIVNSDIEERLPPSNVSEIASPTYNISADYALPSSSDDDFENAASSLSSPESDGNSSSSDSHMFRNELQVIRRHRRLLRASAVRNPLLVGDVDEESDTSIDIGLPEPFMEEVEEVNSNDRLPASTDSADSADISSFEYFNDRTESTEESDDPPVSSWLNTLASQNMRYLNRICRDTDKANVLPKTVEAPKHKWFAVPEILSRAHGVAPRSAGWQRTNVSNMMSQNRTYGALKIAEKLQLNYRLQDVHTGCVNALNFSSDGSRLCSGSDDRQIVVWKWATKEVDIKFDSQHKQNVFQTKFMDYGETGTTIVSSDRIGEVRLHRLLPDGGRTNQLLYEHRQAVHKLAVSSASVSQFLSAGEDASIYHYDLRTNEKNHLTTVTNRRGGKVMLYSISPHPLANKFCVSGLDPYVRVFDCRNAKTPLTRHCADKVDVQTDTLHRLLQPGITCVTYNWNGTEILASYCEENIFLFDANRDELGTFLHQYQGHWNADTVKGVNFFGKYSEFVASGSDSGHIHMWEKNTETAVLFQRGDRRGSVNVIEAHPRFPILATSGLDKDIKIWLPSNNKDYMKSEMRKFTTDNAMSLRSVRARYRRHLPCNPS